jgi:putative transposase
VPGKRALYEPDHRRWLDLRPLPCYDTLRRFMKANGLDRRRRVTARQSAGAERAEARLHDLEVRSYEAESVNGL